jgi:HD-like signal output (HDOD) protein
MSAMPTGQSNAAVERVMSRTQEIAVLPQVVYKIMEMTSSTDSSAALLEKAIVIDPGFSAKILTQANSAYYALPRKVTSIKEAVAFLGFRAVRQLAMAVGVFDLFVGKTDRESLRRRAWWRHSLDTAVCCRFISNRHGLRVGDEVYTVGLLHYIGKTLMDRSNPAEYEKVMMLVEKGATDLQAERAVFGCDHVEVGIAAAVQWGFPDVLVRGMDYLSRPEEGSEYAKIAALVNLGDKIARAAVCGRDSAMLEADGQDWSLTVLGIEDEDLKKLMDESMEAIAAAAVIAF